ncbi:hypothetical protein WMY93_013995 [Mugilogobius chulae]|uniref:Reverse transcriptase domain-containing protein n=1 Tax=Mugilogobius chulae TaxID=88201 RepID=A0AAW0P383_9GOBI
MLVCHARELDHLSIGGGRLEPHSQGRLAQSSRSSAPQGPQGPGGAKVRPGPPTVGYFTREQLDYWVAHTSDTWVLCTLSQGYHIQFRRRPPVPGRVTWTVIHDPAKAQALSQEIAVLLAKGAIVPVDPRQDPGGFYSRYFLVPKKLAIYAQSSTFEFSNGVFKTSDVSHVKTREMLQAISQNDWFTSIDLQGRIFSCAYCTSPPAVSTFCVSGSSLPVQGPALRSVTFAQVLRQVCGSCSRALQARGLRVLPYLDDWLICAPTYSQVVRTPTLSSKHVARLGLRVNLDKSNLIPSQRSVFLGIALDSIAMTARPSDKRIDSIVEMLPDFLEHRCSLLSFTSAFREANRCFHSGTSRAAFPPPNANLVEQFAARSNRFAHRRRLVRMSPQCLESLSQWRDRSWVETGVPLGCLPSRREVVHTDASTTGWGATWQRRLAQGTWPPELAGEHINVLELMAVQRALVHFRPFLSGRHVVIRSDSTTVVHHINHLGAPGSSLPVQGPALRSVTFAQGLRQVCGSCSRASPGTRPEGTALPGRLADLCPHLQPGCSGHPHCPRTCSTVGTQGQPGQEQPDPFPAVRVSGNRPRFNCNDCSSFRQADRQHCGNASRFSGAQGAPFCPLPPPFREANRCFHSGTSRAAFPPPNANLVEQFAARSNKICSQTSSGESVTPVSRVPLTVAGQVLDRDRGSVGMPAITEGSSAHRCVYHRVGRDVAKATGTRYVAPELAGEHINVLELMAVQRALVHFRPFLSGRHVVIRSDSTTVVHHINHLGGTRSVALMLLTRQLLVWAAPHFLSLRAMHIPGVQNVVADFLSRQSPLPGEWRLHSDVVDDIWRAFGRAEVDLYATRETTHCPLWFSLTDSSAPLGQDALAHDWPRTLLYAFPPLPLILLTLLRVHEERHKLLLVAPFWPARIWFPLLRRLCYSCPRPCPSG